MVTIGVFDGVHLGHQALIGHCVDIAAGNGLRAVALTFDPNPLEVLRPDVAPTRLCDIDRRVELIRSMGVDDVQVSTFDTDMAAMSAEQFVAQMLLEGLRAERVVIGHGFRFGHKAAGTAQTLRAHGLTVDEYSLVGGDEPVSSTRIRAAVAAGEVALAAQMLGRSHEVEGVVIEGQKRGRDLGYPTANVAHHSRAAVPADGVYAGTAAVGNTIHVAAISVGTNPTFDGAQRTVEAYLLDFDADLYGQRMRIGFAQRLRPTLAFETVDALVAQMERDVAQTDDLARSRVEDQGG